MLVEQRERHVARLAAHGRRGVEPLAEREQARARRGTVPEISVTRCWTKRSVMTPGLRGDRQACPRPARSRSRMDETTIGVLLAVLLGRQEGAAQLLVLGGIRAATDRAGHGDGPEDVRPSVRTSRSGVAPRNVRPPRRNA